MDNLNEKNNEKDFSLEKAELEEELKKAINDELPEFEISDQNRDDDFIDFDELEEELRKEIDEQLSELIILEENKEKIGNPQSLGETIKNVVWEQFINQIGGTAGEDFIKKNRGLTLDLSKEAHTQTTENFENGKIASHNTEINYQKRYDDWQSNFVRDKDGNIVMRYDRIDDENKAVLNKEARKPFDEGRPKGSSSASVDMDHTVSAGEIIRDSEANAHLSREEQLDFANSNANLNPLDSSANKSKGDHNMENWLGSERDGQKPAERFAINEDQLRNKDKEAREEYAKQKEEGKKKSIEAGKKSQQAEAFRMGGEALRAFVMVLLADLVRKIIKQLIIWLKSAEKNINTFLQSVKSAIVEFVENLKNEVLSAADAAVTAIATAIFGPIVRLIKKAWILLKQSAQTIKEAIQYIKRPENKTKDFEIIMMEVGKIVIVGLSAAGALVLSEVIEKALMEIAFFAIPIPLLGSFGSIIGIFLGALISGIVGALALRIIDNAAAKYQLAKIRQEEDYIYVKVAQTEATLALAKAGNTGTHVARTEEVFVKSSIDMSEKREQTKKYQDETQSTMDEIEKDVNQTTNIINKLKSDEEEFEL
jgi:hypothetical protein